VERRTNRKYPKKESHTGVERNSAKHQKVRKRNRLKKFQSEVLSLTAARREEADHQKTRQARHKTLRNRTVYEGEDAEKEKGSKRCKLISLIKWTQECVWEIRNGVGERAQGEVSFSG